MPPRNFTKWVCAPKGGVALGLCCLSSVPAVLLCCHAQADLQRTQEALTEITTKLAVSMLPNQQEVFSP